jgi:hypothetical protein
LPRRARLGSVELDAGAPGAGELADALEHDRLERRDRLLVEERLQQEPPSPVGVPGAPEQPVPEELAASRAGQAQPLDVVRVPRDEHVADVRWIAQEVGRAGKPEAGDRPGARGALEEAELVDEERRQVADDRVRARPAPHLTRAGSA